VQREPRLSRWEGVDEQGKYFAMTRKMTSLWLNVRFRTIIFWVYEPLDSLRPHLDKRVDKMVENGLLKEIAELRGIGKELYGVNEDHTEGIFQSIGAYLAPRRS
jgi:tRNA A37 N6-isopentenylltransferase MiaA